MDRKLASVQKIVSLDPIPDADRILKATVLGWEVVVAKSDNLKVGDKVIYIEVDSLVPDKPEFQFLKERKFRVRTIKLKKQVSQGLVLPLSILPLKELEKNWNEGDDVTSVLGIRKYDPAADLEAKLLDEKMSRNKNKINKFLMKFPWYKKIFGLFVPKKAGFPSFIKKTDEDRIQLFPNIVEQYGTKRLTCTEKLDGQSVTYFLLRNKKKFLWFGEDYIFGVCSRNLYLPKPDNSSYWTIAKQLNMKEVLKKLINGHDYVILQGEIIGEGIQGNKYKIKGLDFYGFNIITPTTKLNSISVAERLAELDIKSVPVLEKEFYLKPTIPENVEYARGRSVVNPNILREGVVVRDYLGNISFKIINPDFLLKYEE